MNNQSAMPNQVAVNTEIKSMPFSRRKTIKWLLLTASILIGLLLLSLVLAMIGYRVGSGALISGMIVATLPAPLYAALALWIDRFEHAPRCLLFACFLWGRDGFRFSSLCYSIQPS